MGGEGDWWTGGHAVTDRLTDDSVKVQSGSGDEVLGSTDAGNRGERGEIREKERDRSARDAVNSYPFHSCDSRHSWLSGNREPRIRRIGRMGFARGAVSKGRAR